MLHAIVSCDGLANSHAFRLENVFMKFQGNSGVALEDSGCRTLILWKEVTVVHSDTVNGAPPGFLQRSSHPMKREITFVSDPAAMYVSHIDKS